MGAFLCMPKPATTQTQIHLRGSPNLATGLTFDGSQIPGSLGQRLIPFHTAPVGKGCETMFISTPTQIGIRPARDHRLGLQFPKQVQQFGISTVARGINTPGLTGTPIIAITAISSIQPDFKKLSVLCQQLTPLLMVDLHIGV